MTIRFIVFIWAISLILFPGIGHSLTADEICQQKNLTAEQCQLLKSRLSATAGQVTPETMGTGIENQNLNYPVRPAEIQQRREFLERGATSESWNKQGMPAPRSFQGPMVSEEIRTRSMFERLRMAGKYQDISMDLRPFGYEFFQEASVKVVTDRKDIPVPINYVVGSGDEVRIMLWGRVNAQYNLTVDRDGRITIPQIGPMSVGGMTFEQMAKQIMMTMEQMVGANIDITLGALKTIPVFVLGDVQRPGAYTIGSFATITDALLLAGGPNDIGSMRNVQLKRKGILVTTFDLYSLLLKGDKSKDRILQAGDVIFVPVTGPQVGIAGNVKRPAIYELKDRNDLGGLFELAGGIMPTADTQQIQVSRIQKNERQVVVDIDDKKLMRSRTVKLQDGDLVKVFSIMDRDRNAVYLEGNVKRSGKYQYKAGMRVGDVINNSEDLLDETYLEYALIKRIVLPDRKEELVPFNLGKMLVQRDPAHNVALRPEDRIYVFSRWLFMDKPFVTVEGEIRGQATFADDVTGMAREEANGQLRFNGNSQRNRDRNSEGNAGLGMQASPLQDAGAIDQIQAASTSCEIRKDNVDLALKQFRNVEDELAPDQNGQSQIWREQTLPGGGEQTLPGGREQTLQKNRLL